MVGPKQLFVVDTTFILEKTAEAFHGAPLFVLDSKDHTFTYGFIRDLLRLRHSLGIEYGILVVGGEGHRVASDTDVEAVVAFAQKMGLFVLHRPDQNVLDICYHLSAIATHVVTTDIRLVQLSSKSLIVVRPKPPSEYEYLTPETVSFKIGVHPDRIPTFIALHNSRKGSQKGGPLTKRQAIRLIELYGDIEGIYANLEKISAFAIRGKLSSGRDNIQKTYLASTIDYSAGVKGVKTNPAGLIWNIDNKRVANHLHDHRFHSLVRLLPLPVDVKTPTTVEVVQPHKYETVQDKKGLRRLEETLRKFDLCALDTESDGRDPRRATLLGVAFSTGKDEALFVPLLERDLKGISPSDVFAALNRILTKRLKVVGHNIKYDALLLRRNGVKINNIHFDTMLAAYDCYGDWSFFNLSFLAERLLGRRIKSYGEIVGKHETFLDLPLKEMQDHACQDADATLQLHIVLDNELRKRRIRDQFENTTLALSRRLVEYEFVGLPVNPKKLEQLRDDLIDKIKTKKEQVEKALGLKIDIDATKDLASALKEKLNLGGTLGSKSLSLRRLEELAISYPDVRGIVEYKRLRKQLKRVESISLSAKENKIYPLFNQIRRSSGRLSSTDPSLFENDGLELLKGCIDSATHDFWGDSVKAINLLQSESEDKNLQLDRSKRQCDNLFMASHHLMKELDYNELLLSVVCGLSGPAMSRQFMLERINIDSICYDLIMRYDKLFAWITTFRNNARSQGFVTGAKGRKYLDGLRSSNLAKRKKASDDAIKWFLDF